MDPTLTLKDVLRFLEILEQMDVPKDRIDDVDWLNRNLHIRNKDHPDFAEANALLDRLLKNR